MRRRDFLKGAMAVAATAMLGGDAFGASARPPNIVLINCDDAGWGDFSCYGSEKIATPNIDAMAKGGVRFTDFYSCAPVCTPSRAGLMTGRYPIRSGMTRVLGPVGSQGIPDNEITLGMALKKLGYWNAIIGKWHLGHQPRFLPTRHGFDYYFGIPYSNNMGEWKDGWPDVPLMRNEEIIERPVPQDTLTKRYTEETIRLIKERGDKPFFIYLAHNMPHNPVYASEQFKGKSKGGKHGDAVEEIDWSTGEIVKALREQGLERNTLVLFTSDNGPNAGSAGILRGKKTQVFEGGMRDPLIAYQPGVIPAGVVCRQPASNLDIFPTLVKMAGGQVPTDRPIDGRDIWKLITVPSASLPDYNWFYFRTHALQAIRFGKWKMHVGRETEMLAEPELYDLNLDIRERQNLAKMRPEVVSDLKKRMDEFMKTLPPNAAIGGSPTSF